RRGFELDPKVRDTVHLFQASLLDPSLLADQPPYDVIFCRNLLIYLTDSARTRAMATLNRLLAESGVLILGHADSLGDERTRFVPASDRRCFAYRRAPQGVPLAERCVPSPQAGKRAKLDPPRRAVVHSRSLGRRHADQDRTILHRGDKARGPAIPHEVSGSARGV